MKLMMLTGDTSFAKKAEDLGVDRIFLDLEYINKTDRQKGRNTFISKNSVADIEPLRKVLTKSELLVRVNPINPLSEKEIDEVCDQGADMIMLPMAYDADDVKKFVDAVGGRAKTVPMIETAQAMARIDDILKVPGIDEIYIGLNDLHISLGLSFMFEVLSGGLVDYMASKIKAAGIPFGFGGIAKIGEGILPAEMVLAEHYRLGSQAVILSRTFRNEVDADGKPILDLKKEIGKIRDEEQRICSWSEEQFEQNRLKVKKAVYSFVNGNV